MERTSNTLLRSVNYLKPNKLFSEMFNKSSFNDRTNVHGKNCILFDLRSKEDFEKKQISNISINIPFNEQSEKYFSSLDPKLLYQNISNANLKLKLQNYKRYYLIIIFSNSSFSKKQIVTTEEREKSEALDKALLLYQGLVQKKIREIGILNKGFNVFEKNYSFLISYNGENCRASDIGDFPTEIFSRRLFIGNEHNVYQ